MCTMATIMNILNHELFSKKKKMLPFIGSDQQIVLVNKKKTFKKTLYGSKYSASQQIMKDQGSNQVCLVLIHTPKGKKG